MRALVEDLAAGAELVMVNPQERPPAQTLPGATALFVDREKTGLGLDAAAALIAEARSRGLHAVLRADGLAPEELAQCAALRPDAVVLPQIVSAAQAEAAIAALGPGACAAIPQIETPQAVSGAAALVAIPGAAAFLIGPNDLAAAMGFAGDPDRAEVVAAMDQAVQALAQAGRPFGAPTLTRTARDAWKSKGAQLFYLTVPALINMEPA